MSEADLAALRDQYAATNERDFERAMSHYDEDVVLTVPQYASFLVVGTFEGREAVGRFFADWFRSFDNDLHFEIVTLEELEDGSILVVANHTARGRASGVELTDQVVWTYRMRDGKITRVAGHETAEAARAAASAQGQD